MVLSGANTYTGTTLISNGTVRLAFSFSGNVLPATSAVQIAAGALLDINGGGQIIGSLSGAGTLTNSNAAMASALTMGSDNTSQTFSGVLTAAPPANLALIKIGSGTQTLSGPSTYTGGTTIGGGGLLLDFPRSAPPPATSSPAAAGLPWAAAP